MQVHVDDGTPPTKFHPITITLTITTPDELAALWHRLDVGQGYLTRRYKSSTRGPKVPFPEEWDGCEPNAKDSTEELFKAVDQLAFGRKLRHGGKIGH